MRGIVFTQMEPADDCAADFDRWYDVEQIPARLAVPGVDAATRYRAVEGDPKFLTVYDLADMTVLDTPEYQAIEQKPSAETARMLSSARGLTRYICEEISDSGESPRRGDYLVAVAFTVPPEDLAQFDDWYESEHAEMLLKADDWLRVRRYSVRPGAQGGDWNRFAVHELANLEVMDSPERAAARQGPKREALAGRPWYGRSGRWLYQVIARA